MPRVASDFTSKPVSHIAQTMATRNGFSAFFNSCEAARVSARLQGTQKMPEHFSPMAGPEPRRGKPARTTKT